MKILKNAKIYTVNDKNPWASVLAYDGEHIVYVGDGVDKKYDDEDIIDMSGRFILPGFIDSHIHPASCCTSAWHIRLPWTENVDELLAFIAAYAKIHPKEEVPFLYFEYYPTSMFDKNGPRKEMLDAVISDRPCLCQDFGEHLCWVNSKMLELLGVSKDTPNPNELAVFVRDKQGEATGWIKENAWRFLADNMYRKIGWRPPERLIKSMIAPFFRQLTEWGITAIFDGFIENEAHIRSIYELDKAGKLNLCYDGSVRFWRYGDLPEKIELLRDYQRKYETEYIKINTMKLFLDGTNESGNSASLHEHINNPGNYGHIAMDTSELTKCLLVCNEEKLDLHIHMVGDRAFRVGCDAVEAAQKEVRNCGGSWNCQPVFAHCEVVDPVDMERPAKLGITINWTCHWAGGYFGEEAMNYYSEEKWRRMYRFNEMIKAGACVAFSSDVVTDYEFHRAAPFFGMQVAMTRVDPEFPLDAARYPGCVRPMEDAAISLENLVRGYTWSGAKQIGRDREIGSLEVGKLANFIVTSENIFDVQPGCLKDVKAETVVFRGNVLKGRL